MKFKKSLLGTMISMALTTSVLPTGATASNLISVSDASKFTAAKAYTSNKKASANYIVQLKGASGVAKAEELGELLPSNQRVALGHNNYNAGSTNMTAYTARLKSKQASMVADFTSGKLLHSYVHTFNGFSAVMSSQQAEALRSHPDVAGVWEDEVFVPQTVNTPTFLGLAGPSGGLHTEGVEGEGVIVGILDTGIIPEHPSFADDGTYGPPGDLGWKGICDAGDEANAGTFVCNNKLIGARFFNASFASEYDIRYDLGEFASPRDADGHGSHTSSTAAGNAGVLASRTGVEIGNMSGMAPRARVAMYKVCWNSNYVSPEGVEERGCFFGDSMAAIDMAIADGVDVLNYSIGNSADLNTPVYNASLRANQAGVLFAASSGNSGPGPSTSSNVAPWITTVAASTYDGVVAVVGTELQLSSPDVELDPLVSIEGDITTPVPAEGFTDNLVAIKPALACNSSGPIENAAAIDGNIALIARGACNFSEKILNAQIAGATGVVVYSSSDQVIAMGGDSTGITIPGVMINNEDGLNLAIQLETLDITATMSHVQAVGVDEVQGNTMAGFSSRGPNSTPQDIIKPDITAPGVQILAATSPTQLDISDNEQGENFAYLQGTSMSSPHIAGIAALIKGEHEDWTPTQIKSAMMTTARQNLTKENGFTQADPFDFGAGHTVPRASLNPGLIYDANIKDYLGFLCGQGEAGIVDTYGDGSQDCASIANEGFATDPSQLNYPSIAISALAQPEEISRTVTDVTGANGNYTVSVEAPAGIGVAVKTFDANGDETESGNLVVEANGKASYSLTFTRLEGFTPDVFAFGAITLTAEDGTEVRSPIAIKPLPDIKISVPEFLSLDLNRGRGYFPVEMHYSGKTSIDYSGFVGPEFVSGSVVDSGQANFDFGTAIDLGQYFLIAIPEGTQVARFNLFDSFVSAPDTDLDLHVWNCIAFSCSPVASSEFGGSDEEVILVNPDPRNGVGGNLYIVLVHGYDLNGETSVDYYLPLWIAEPSQRSTRIISSKRAIEGRFNNVVISTRGLSPNLYMGGVTFYSAEGEAEGTTVLEMQP